MSLKSQIAQIGRIVKITEGNDANNLIGRPGQYDAATFMDPALDGTGPTT